MTMKERQWWFRSLRLSDLSSLNPTLTALLPARDGKSLIRFIRLLKESCHDHVYLIGHSPAESSGELALQLAGEAVALAGFQLSHDPGLLEATANQLSHHPYTYGLSWHQTGTLYFVAVAAAIDSADDSNDPAAYRSMLIDTAQKLAFRQLNLYRLTWPMKPAQAEEWQDSLIVSGWHQGGIVKRGLFDSASATHLDAHLYYFYAVEAKDIGLAFTLFRQGVLAVSGHKAAITQTSFTHFGDRFQLPRLQAMADWLGLLDADGRLSDEISLRAKFTKEKVLYLKQTPLPVQQAAHQAAEYFAGQRKQFDLPLALDEATSFQKQVLKLLAEIPYGETCTYGDLARKIRPDDERAERVLSRAVGHACGSNPLPLFLPCHRVIGSDGKLTGFSGGLDIKEYLLAHEIMGLS